MLDADVLGEELGALVLEHVKASTAPLIAQIQALEARIAALPIPQNGKDVDPVFVAQLVGREVDLALARLPAHENGKDADPEIIRLQVAEAVSAIPKPKDAQPVDLAWLSGTISEAAAKAVAAIPKPKDAAPVDLAWFSATISEAAAKAIETIPKPKDGLDFDPVALDAAVQRAVAAIPKPKDGEDADPPDTDAIAAAVLEKVTKALEEIPVPKDGKDADAALIAADVLQRVTKTLEQIPPPKNGKDADPEMVRLVAAETLPAMVEKAQAMLDQRMQDSLAAIRRDALGSVEAHIASIPKPQDGKSVEPAEVEALVRRHVEQIQIATPKDGRDADDDLVRPIVTEIVQRELATWPRPRDGNDAEPVDTVWLAGELVSAAAKAVEALPRPQDGQSVEPDEVEAMVRKAVDALPTPQDGRSVEPAEVEAMVRRAVEAIPKPKDGRDVTMSEVQELVQRAVAALPPPVVELQAVEAPDVEAAVAGEVDKRVQTLQSALIERIDQRFAAIPTPRDGKSVTLEDVEPAVEQKFATWALEFERRATDLLLNVADQIPVPKDGKDGLDLDAFGLELDEDGRTLKFTLVSGDKQFVKPIKVPWPVYRGVFVQGRQYAKGDNFTYGGSVWMTDKDSTGTERPGDDSGVYRLAVKRGADAK